MAGYGPEIDANRYEQDGGDSRREPWHEAAPEQVEDRRCGACAEYENESHREEAFSEQAECACDEKEDSGRIEHPEIAVDAGALEHLKRAIDVGGFVSLDSLDFPADEENQEVGGGHEERDDEIRAVA